MKAAENPSPIQWNVTLLEETIFYSFSMCKFSSNCKSKCFIDKELLYVSLGICIVPYDKNTQSKCKEGLSTDSERLADLRNHPSDL